MNTYFLLIIKEPYATRKGVCQIVQSVGGKYKSQLKDGDGYIYFEEEEKRTQVANYLTSFNVPFEVVLGKVRF